MEIVFIILGIVIGYFISTILYRRFLKKKLRDRSFTYTRGIVRTSLNGYPILAEVIILDKIGYNSKIKILNVTSDSLIKKSEFKQLYNRGWIESRLITLGSKEDILKNKLELLLKRF